MALVLTGRKQKLAAGKQMEMQVKYGLSAVAVAIDHYSVTIVGKFLSPSDLRGGQHQMADEALVIDLVQRIKMLPRYYQ